MNRQLLKTFPFDKYLELPGVSHSAIKGEGAGFKQPTQKMQLGTLVHNYLLTPAEYNYEHFDLVRPLAVALKRALGASLPLCLPEVVALADFIHDGFTMPFKGRIDLAIPGRLIIDLKVSEMHPKRFIDYFKTENQLAGYALAVDAPLAFIVFINPKTKVTHIENVPFNTAWWEYHTKRKGQPMLTFKNFMQ